MAINVAGSHLPSGLEVPLGVLSGFTVDDEGRIYCAVESYGRLQQYDSEGRFLKGTYIPASAGAFRVVWNDESHRVVVATARNQMVYELNGDLDVVSRTKNLELFFELDRNWSASVIRSDAVYRLSDFFLLYPRIIKTNPGGAARTIVTTPLYLWVVMSPAPAFLYIVVGVALRFRIER
jgi:hypothetical protein